MRRAAVCAVGLLLAGCSGPSAYQRVFEQDGHANARTYAAGVEDCWLAVNRAALSLNFGLDKEEKDKGLLEAVRHFQDGKRTTTLTLKVSLQPEGRKETTVYVNAVELKERVFARSHRRFFLWIIPLPGGGGVTASRLTEGEKTVEDGQFYTAFFDAVGKELYTLEHARVSP